MSTNKKFRIQNGADIHGGGLSIDDVIVIGADGKVVAGAIQEAVAELTAADIADLQAQVTAILGTSPETLDTLQEIVTAFENADSTLTGSVAQNAADISTINNTLQSGVATPSDIAALEATIGDTSQLPRGASTYQNYLALRPRTGTGVESVLLVDPLNPTSGHITLPSPEGEYDSYGEQVLSIPGKLLVSAMRGDTGADNAGGVFVYNSTDFSEAPTKLQSPTPTEDEFFGEVMTKNDNSVIISGRNGFYVYDINDLTSAPTYVAAASSVMSPGQTRFAATDYNRTGMVATNTHLYAGVLQYGNDNYSDGHGALAVFDLQTLSGTPVTFVANNNFYGFAGNLLLSEDGTKLYVATGSSSTDTGGLYVYSTSSLNSGSTSHLQSVMSPENSWYNTQLGSPQNDEFAKTMVETNTKLFVGASLASPGPNSSNRDMQQGSLYVYDKNNLSAAPLEITAPQGGDFSDAVSNRFTWSMTKVGGKVYISDRGDGANQGQWDSVAEGKSWVYEYDAENPSSPISSFNDDQLLGTSSGLYSFSEIMHGAPLEILGNSKTVVSLINELESEIVSLSSLQSGDTSSLTSAIATAKSEAISTAAADATTKADQAEADAKAYADQVVAATVDAAPAALDTLNELAAALGDDANFASTVTASISTKADDAATTAALATKADQSALDTLDTFVGDGRTSPPNAITSIAASNWTVLKSGITITDNPDGTVTFTTDGSNAGEMAEILVDVDNDAYEFEASVVGYHATAHHLFIKRASDNASISGFAFNQGGDVGGNGSGWNNTGGYADQVKIIINFGSVSGGTSWTFSSINLYDPDASYSALDTSAQNIAGAINEVVSSVASLTSGTSSDLAAETAARIAGDASTLSSASSDATSKADAAEASAKAYADQVVAATVDAAPAALDTLNELAAALGDDANFASTVTTSIATKASQVDHDAEVARATAAEQANAAAIAAANSRTSGISTSSGSSNIQMTAEVDMDSNDIKNAGDVYAARGFIDTIEAESLTVQTGTVSFEGSTVNFGSSTITGGGFSSATNAQIDQHLNVSTANTGEFVKWNGTDYEWTDYIQGRVASTMIEVEGTLKTEQPGSTLDWQNGLVHFGGSQVIVDTPTSSGLAANKSYVDAETTLVAGDGISVDNLTHTVSLDGSAISQNLVPDSDNVYTLGSPDKVWKDVYIGPGSLYIGGQKVIEDNSGTITINADPNQNLTVQTTGTGGLSVQSTGSGGISIDAASESVQVKSDMVVSVGKTISTVGGAATKFGGDIDMQTNTVSGLGAPSMDADAATKLYVDDRIAESTISGGKTFSDDVIISGNLTVSGTTTTVNSETISLADNIIDLNSNLTSGSPSEDAGIRIMRGDASAVQLRWNETSDHWETYNGSAWTKIALSTSDLAEGSNQYFTEERAKACLTGGLCITYSSVTGEIKVDEAEAESSLRVAESAASDDADKLDGQEGTYYRINVYNVAGTLVN